MVKCYPPKLKIRVRFLSSLFINKKFVISWRKKMNYNLNFDYNKLYLKDLLILIPKKHNNLVSFLTPILGLYGINVREFINEFESRTSFIDLDIIIPVKLEVSKIKTYNILFKTPYISNIVSNFEYKFHVDILTIYKFVLLKSIYNSKTIQLNLYLNIYCLLRNYFFKRNVVELPSNITNNANLNLIFSIIKKNIIISKTLKKLIYNKYGFFIRFNNPSNKKLNKLEQLFNLYGIQLFKLPSKLVSPFLKFCLNGNLFFWGSRNFSNFFSILNIVKNDSKYSFITILEKFNNNIGVRFFIDKALKWVVKVSLHSLFRIILILNYRFIKTLFVKKYSFCRIVNAYLSSINF